MLTAYPRQTQTPGRLQESVSTDLKSPTEAEAAEVVAATGLHIPDREEISAIEASSRLRRVRDALYLSTPLLSAGETPHLTPVGFVLSRQRLVTVRFDELGAFQTAAENAEGDDEITSLGVFTCVLESIVDRAADALELLAGEQAAISREVFHGPRRNRSQGRREQRQRQVLDSIGRIGERLSQTRDVLLGIGRLAAVVIEVRHAAAAGAIADRLNAVRQDIASLNDYEAQLADKVQFLLDAILGFISISQNDIFKLLTVWSIVGIPPTLMAGIWGMIF